MPDRPTPSYGGDETVIFADFGGPCPHVQALQQLREEWQRTTAIVEAVEALVADWRADPGLLPHATAEVRALIAAWDAYKAGAA